jgi:hypothetical protein
MKLRNDYKISQKAISVNAKDSFFPWRRSVTDGKEEKSSPRQHFKQDLKGFRGER